MDETIFDRVVIGLSMIKPRFRVALGCCPLCNSDAPELDDCPLCNSYHTARGDESPPPKYLKQRWLKEMRGVEKAKRTAKKLVRMARNKRLTPPTEEPKT